MNQAQCVNKLLSIIIVCSSVDYFFIIINGKGYTLILGRRGKEQYIQHEVQVMLGYVWGFFLQKPVIKLFLNQYSAFSSAFSSIYLHLVGHVITVINFRKVIFSYLI